jgi:hypothetical protein
MKCVAVSGRKNESHYHGFYESHNKDMDHVMRKVQEHEEKRSQL